jgi:hypothetical protein
LIYRSDKFLGKPKAEALGGCTLLYDNIPVLPVSRDTAPRVMLLMQGHSILPCGDAAASEPAGDYHRLLAASVKGSTFRRPRLSACSSPISKPELVWFSRFHSQLLRAILLRTGGAFQARLSYRTASPGIEPTPERGERSFLLRPLLPRRFGIGDILLNRMLTAPTVPDVGAGLGDSHQYQTSKKETIVAKGQVRGNREVRKPKKDKSTVKTSSAEGSQVKFAGASVSFGKKDKK